MCYHHIFSCGVQLTHFPLTQCFCCSFRLKLNHNYQWVNAGETHVAHWGSSFAFVSEGTSVTSKTQKCGFETRLVSDEVHVLLLCFLFGWQCIVLASRVLYCLFTSALTSEQCDTVRPAETIRLPKAQFVGALKSSPEANTVTWTASTGLTLGPGLRQ